MSTMHTLPASNPFHEYLASRLAERVVKHRLAVWYDPREEFRGFIAELRGQAEITTCAAETVTLGSSPVRLICKNGSLFEAKLVAEPFVSSETVEPLLVYLPGERVDQPTLNVLLELEKAGTPIEWKLAQMARHCLQQFMSDDHIDQVLKGEGSITYADIVSVLTKVQASGGGGTRGGGGGSGGSGSILDAILPAARTNAEQVAAWIATPGSDPTIENKGGRGEILRLATKLGLTPDAAVALGDLRREVARHVLVGEFVLDLKGPRPPSTKLIASPANIEQQKLLRQTAEAFRRAHPDQYEALADQVEVEFQLATSGVQASDLGSIDTFRFEEKVFLTEAGLLVAAGRCGEVTVIVSAHARSFWADRSPARQQQWEACRLMAALGQEVVRVKAALPATTAGASVWFRGYTNPQTGWYQVDTRYRQLQSHLATMTDLPDSEAAQHAVLNAYDDLADGMATKFAAVLQAASWQVPGDVLRQPQVFDEIVTKPTPDGGPVALILADSLRYEMGVELSMLFADAKSLEVKAAAAVIPTITPICMAALLPGASRSFDVVDAGGKVGARIDGKVMTCLKDRMNFLQSKVPATKDITLDDLLATTNASLKSRLHSTRLLVVRSQEIDLLGENAPSNLARQVMDTSVSNIARGIRRLAQCGISRFIVVADHGHIFGREKAEDMRIDPPGGQTIEIHRRCWIGRGGVTPPGTVRISSADLGQSSDIDMVFPTGTGVFRAGDGLSYHHGGMSLQEMVVPVIVLELATAAAARTANLKVTVADAPARIKNRFFPITLTIAAEGLFAEKAASVRVSLVHKGTEVGCASQAIDAVFDGASKTVKLEIGKTAKVLVHLVRDDVKTAKLVIEDASSRAMLYQSETDLPVEVL